jgi:AbrB family looped-hinge helix DNA binding protein
MRTLTTLTISPQGQITIPKEWREILKVKPGEKLLAWLKEGVKAKVLTLKPEPASWADYVAGLGQEVWKDVNVETYLKKERDSWD